MEARGGGGSVEAYAATLPEPGRSLLNAIRSALLDFGGVTERMIVDYDAREESPAFYVGARQLCHAHAEPERLACTISLGRALTFEVLRSHDVPEEVRAIVERTKEYGATRWVSIPITRREDVGGLLSLAKLKHRFLGRGGVQDELSIPRDQTTLEKFA